MPSSVNSARALAGLREAITKLQAPEADKMNLVADNIETVQIQLAKSIPNRGIISTAWSAIKGAAVIAGCIPLVESVQRFHRALYSVRP
jgi:hypothetical protein